MVNHIGGAGRSGFNTLVTVILLSCGLVNQVLHFKIENTPIKDTNGKRKFKRILSFLFVDKRELFAMKLSFVEFNPVFFTADQNTWLVLNQPRQRGLWRNLRYILNYMVKEIRLWRGFFVFIKASWTFSTFWHGRERKTTKCAFEIDFLPCAQPIWLAWTDPRSSLHVLAFYD